MINKTGTRHSQGLRILDKVLSEKSWDILTENQIKDDDFFADSAVCLRFIRKYHQKHGQFPPKDILESDAKIIFPSDVARTYAVEDFNKYKLVKQLQSVFVSAKDKIMSDPFECLMILKQRLREITVTNVERTFKENAEESFLEYVSDKLKVSKGISPAYPSMEEAFDVYENGSINAVLGTTGSGKSWMSCVTASHAAFEQDKKVLLVSMENTKRSMYDRINSLYYKLPFGHLKRGMLDFRTQHNWYQSIPHLEDEVGDIMIVDASTTRTVPDIAHLVSSYEPDFVIVDGAYKIDAQLRSTKYEQSSKTLQDLEDLAKLADIPLLATSQLNKTANKAVGGREIGGEARGNQEWMNNPGTVCTLVLSDDDLVFGRVLCSFAKIREAGGGVGEPFYINQNKVLMDFDEIREDHVDESLLSTIF